MNPRVYFVGAGPGPASLLTLRGKEVLGRGELVYHDALVHPDVLAFCPGARVPVGKDELDTPALVASAMVAQANAGKVVVRLTTGDPYLFGSGESEVATVARAAIAFEVVPGIDNSLAAGAYGGIVLSRCTDASPSVVLADAHGGLAVHDWAKLSDAADTLAVAVSSIDVDELARILVFYGRPPTTPAAAIVDVAQPSQRVVLGTLDDIAKRVETLGATTVRLFVGDVIARRQDLAWFDRGPLFAKRVLLTRAQEQAESTAALLAERGAEAIIVPTLEFHPPSNPDALARAVATAGTYDWVAFTSANGVLRSLSSAFAQGLDARVFGGAKIAAIGTATRDALLGYGLRADVMAKEFRSEGLAEEMLRAMQGKGAAKVLLLRAQDGRDALPETLRSSGCTVEVVPAYATKAALSNGPIVRGLLAEGKIDAVMFSSGSTVHNLCDLLGPDAPSQLARVCVASIGPVTTAVAQKRGLRVDVTADPSTLVGLVDALASTFSKGC